MYEKQNEFIEYKAINQRMVLEEDLPCQICGVQNSTLDDAIRNSYHSKQVKTQRIIERFLVNLINIEKFKTLILPHLRYRHPTNPDYQKKIFTEIDIINWVDHNPDNLWVFCDVHNRAQYFDFNDEQHPFWSFENLQKDNLKDSNLGEKISIENVTNIQKEKNIFLDEPNSLQDNYWILMGIKFPMSSFGL